MMASSQSPEDREWELISKLELRIALADSDTKLESILRNFLAPLLLKLSSDRVQVRNKVIGVCQHINKRIGPPSISLPVAALIKQFKDVQAPLVKHFDLSYIKQGIDRMAPSSRVEILPSLVQGISQIDSVSHSATVFSLVLRLLPLLQLPQRGGDEDLSLRSKLGLSKDDSLFLARWFAKVLLLTPASNHAPTCPGLTPLEYTFVNAESPYEQTWNASGLNLVQTKEAIVKFLASGAFDDNERFIPTVIALADANSRVSDVGDDIMKRFRPDLENQEVVDQLYILYFGTKDGGENCAPPARPPVQGKALSFLSKSVKATMDTQRINQLLDEGFLSTTSIGGSGLEASKLRNQIFSFVTWVTRMGSTSDLNAVAPKAIRGLQEFISNQGWPSPGSNSEKPSIAEIDLRSLAYETIGLLAPKIDRGSARIVGTEFDLDLARWLFTSLGSDSSSGQIFVSIEQALGGLLNAIANTADQIFQSGIRPILIHYMNTKPDEIDALGGSRVVRGTRFAAVRFANRSLPYGDIQARWIDLMAVDGASGERSEIMEEGQKGLDPYWYRMLNPLKEGMFISQSSMEVDRTHQYSFPRFVELSEELFRTDDDEVAEAVIPTKFSSGHVESLGPAVSFVRNILLHEALKSSGTILEIEPEWEHRLDAMISTKEGSRSAVRSYLQQLNNAAVVSFLRASLSGLLWNNGQGLGRCGDLCLEILSLSSNRLILAIFQHTSSLNDVILSNNMRMQHIGAQIFGIVASHPEYPSGQRAKHIAGLASHISGWKDASVQALNRVRGAVLALTFLYTRLSFRRQPHAVPENEIQGHVHIVFEILQGSRDLMLKDSCQTAIAQLSLASLIPPATLLENDFGKTIIGNLLEDAKKEKETAVTALGRLSLVLSKAQGASSLFEHLLNALYGLHEIRRPELQFAVGEALSTVAIGWAAKSLVSAFDVDADWPQSDIPSHVLPEILSKVILGCKASKPSLRKASAIWLLCLVQYCGHIQIVKDQFRQCQATFIWLLSDRDEIVQEASSRGLGMVYDMGTQDLKDDLVRDLVRSFTAEGSNLGGGKISADTELFEPGALPTGEGSVTTYKDIVGLASEVGDPSLVYRFMSMASNNAIWSSRAAFGRFGLSNVLSDSSVTGYLAQNPKVYPKLYRYRFDPNPNVQRSMNDIWNSLVKDSNAVIDTHFDAIMEDLLKSILSGREWRVRQASCSAIGDLVQGRQIDKYDKYLSDILGKAFKVLDDIKGSVRQAALGLCQVLTNIVLRALETGDSNSKRAKTMLNHIIPFLLSHEGMESSAEEVQSYAISTITKIIKKSPAQILRPFVPQILEKFLASLSSLEPQAVNYVHLNADKYGLTGQDIDRMRLSAIRTSPMMEAIELYLLDTLDDESMAAVAAKLEAVLRSAIGLPSKVGISRVLVILSSKSILFRPHADRFIHLMRKQVLDRNETVSVSFSSSVGYLARLASSEEVLKTIEFAKSLYFEAEETPSRAISGEILHSISNRANNRIQEFASSALPFVFVGIHDSDDQVKEIFDKTWKDNVSGTRAISLYMQEICDLVSSHLESPRWDIKHTSATTIAAAASSLDDSINTPVAERIWPILERAVGGKTWEGKEKVLDGFVKFCSHAKPFSAKNGIGEQMKIIILREAKRRNAVYRPHALKCLGAFGKNHDDIFVMDEALKTVSEVVDELADGSKDKMEIDSSNNGTQKLEEQTLAAAIDCLLHCLNPKGPSQEFTQHMREATPIIERAVLSGGRAIYNAKYEGLKIFFGRLEQQLSINYEGVLVYKEVFESDFLDLTHRLLFDEPDLSIEATRNKRAEAAFRFICVCEKAKIQVPEAQGRKVDGWLASERSSQVQATLRQVLEKAKQTGLGQKLRT